MLALLIFKTAVPETQTTHLPEKHRGGFVEIAVRVGRDVVRVDLEGLRMEKITFRWVTTINRGGYHDEALIDIFEEV